MFIMPPTRPSIGRPERADVSSRTLPRRRTAGGAERAAERIRLRADRERARVVVVGHADASERDLAKASIVASLAVEASGPRPHVLVRGPAREELDVDAVAGAERDRLVQRRE